MPIFHDPESELLAELREKVLKDGVPYEKTDLSKILQKTGYEGCPPLLIGEYRPFEDVSVEVVMAMKGSRTAIILIPNKGWSPLGDFNNETGKYHKAYFLHTDGKLVEEADGRIYNEFNTLKNARDAAGLETRVEEITAEEFAEMMVGTMRREHPLIVESVTAASKNTVNRHKPPWYTRAYRALKRVFKKGQ